MSGGSQPSVTAAPGVPMLLSGIFKHTCRIDTHTNTNTNENKINLENSLSL